jgi:hypothetical protein
MDYKEFSHIIIALKHTDLALRNKLILARQLGEGYHKEMEILHIHNAGILNDIIEKIGYPTIDKVGREASEAAWLVIQHSISQPGFMKKCVRLLENEVNNNQADPGNLAYLADRIAAFENRPQLYGTQFDWDENGNLSPNSFDELNKVNERRKSIGLNTLEEQTELIRKRAKTENQSAPADVELRKQEIEKWKRSVGWIK